MSTAKLQINLINRITGITDEMKLREILQLLQFQSAESVYITSPEDKKAIAEARKQIAHGATFTHKEVQKEIQECLNR